MFNNIIFKEGYKYILWTLGSAIFFSIVLGFKTLSLLLYITTFILLYIFRNLKQDILKDDKNILSPINGTIKAIDITGAKIKIFIDISFCKPHGFYAPISGTISIKSHHFGANLLTWNIKAKKLNEQMILKQKNITMTLIDGLCGIGFSNFKIPNSINQGEKLGVFLNGILIVECKSSMQYHTNIGKKIKVGDILITQ